jgi:uncharacterized repeat protein (TIGR03803 family)
MGSHLLLATCTGTMNRIEVEDENEDDLNRMRACGDSSGMENRVLKSLAKSELFRRVVQGRRLRPLFGVRRQSGAATALSPMLPDSPTLKRCRTSLATALHSRGGERVWWRSQDSPVVRNLLFYLALLLGIHLLTSSATGAITFKALNSFSANTGTQPFGQLLRSTNGLFYGTTASGGENGSGAIYSATTGGALNLVASFDGTNGAQPLAGLIQGPDGNFYGTASAGGAFGKGTVFRASEDGTLTNLFSFDGTNGTRPLGSLTFGADGNFYGTTSAGGAFDLGTIFRMDGTGNVALVFSFNGTNGAQPANALVQVADGTFYGTTLIGGVNGYGTIFNVSTVGAFTSAYSFTGGLDGAGPQSGLTLGSDGRLYGTTSTGGTNIIGQGAGTVFVFAPGVFGTLHRFIGTDGANPFGALVEGASGVMYGTTRSGGLSSKGAIFSLNMFNGNLTNLFSFNGQAGSGPVAGLTGGTNGNFFGVTSGGGRNGVGNYFQLSGFSPFIIQSPPSPITIVAGDTLVLRVIAGGTAPLSYQWQLNSNNVVNGKFISGATSPNLTVSNITTMQAGVYFVTVRNSAGQIASASASVSVVPRPTIGFTAPQRGAHINSSSLTIKGTTSGEAAVARVYFQLDDGGWQLAASSDNWAHWRGDVTMPKGNHVVDAFAESVLSTFSKTNSVAFTCVVTSAPVVVEISGDGMVNPNLDGQFLQLGKSYSMTAIPAIGSVFAGWSGDVETNAPKVVFVMQSNLVLQANFQPDLFFTGKGTYNGLFQTEGDVSPTNSGLFALTLNGRGAFSGHVQLGLVRTAFAKSFDINGNAQVTVPRRNLNRLTLNLQLLSDENINVIIGTVSDGIWTAELNAYRAVFNANTNPAPAAGRYTLAIFGDPGSTNVPGGDSWGVLTMNLGGMIVFSGFLSDNTKISQNMPISQEGNWPFYIPLYGNHGLISGWLTFTSVNSATGSIAGSVIWFKPEVPTAKYYPQGFRVSSDAIGSSYVRPPDGVAIVDFGGNPVVTFSGGDLTNDIVNPIALDALNRVTNLGTNPMNLSFSVTNGVFRGNVTDPNSGQLFPVRGVVLQNQNSAAGYFLGPTQSGEVRLGGR